MRPKTAELPQKLLQALSGLIGLGECSIHSPRVPAGAGLILRTKKPQVEHNAG